MHLYTPRFFLSCAERMQPSSRIRFSDSVRSDFIFCQAASFFLCLEYSITLSTYTSTIRYSSFDKVSIFCQFRCNHNNSSLSDNRIQHKNLPLIILYKKIRLFTVLFSSTQITIKRVCLAALLSAVQIQLFSRTFRLR